MINGKWIRADVQPSYILGLTQIDCSQLLFLKPYSNPSSPAALLPAPFPAMLIKVPRPGLKKDWSGSDGSLTTSSHCFLIGHAGRNQRKTASVAAAKAGSPPTSAPHPSSERIFFCCHILRQYFRSLLIPPLASPTPIPLPPEQDIRKETWETLF